jgi:hypothetical protein
MIFFEKSQPGPAALEKEKGKASGTYLLPEVLEQLIMDFKNKCYICENNEIISMNVEHIVAHRKDPDLKFDWDNLFLACSHCNNTKLDKFDDILNCTVLEEDVEGAIHLKMDPYPFANVQVSARKNNHRVDLTIELLKLVYNGSTDLKSHEAINLRKKIYKEIIDFQVLLGQYITAKEHNDDEALKEYRRFIKWKLNSRSPFTAFKRWIIRDIEGLNREFADLLSS